MLEDVLRVQLRQHVETEAVSVAERAAGTLPGARNVAVAFADLVGFTRLGEAVPPEGVGKLASRLSNLAHDVGVATGAVHQDDRRRGDVGQHRPGALLRTALELLGAAEK